MLYMIVACYQNKRLCNILFPSDIFGGSGERNFTDFVIGQNPYINLKINANKVVKYVSLHNAVYYFVTFKAVRFSFITEIHYMKS